MNAWAITDRGKRRTVNQDAFYYNISEQGAVALVCDGMGGAAAGDVASRLAAQTFVEELGKPAESVEQAMFTSAEKANEAVLSYTEEHPECMGMGTTLVAVTVMGTEAYILNIGDSRCYYMSEEEGIRQVTEDHSVVADLVRSGVITPQMARTHPQKNLITRCIGSVQNAQGDLFKLDMKPGSVLLLCSDGLSNLVEDQELLFEVLYGGDMDDCCRRLIDMTLQRGAPDNATVVLLQADKE